MNDKELIEKLKNYNTPSITNIVATYPQNPLCLGLYEPWSQNWYTDQSIHCIYPELGRTVGYAVTAVYGLPDPSYNRYSLVDLLEAIWKSPKPVIVSIKQDFPPHLIKKVGLCGGQMTTAFKACGAVGVVTNGPSRDIDEIRPMKFQYMMSGVTAGHGPMAIRAINVPVTIAGMDVAPGEIIHMDENGACKFPADQLEKLSTNIVKLIQAEEARADALNAAKNIEDIRAVFIKKDE